MEDLSYLKSNDTLSFPANDINTCTTFSSDIIYLNNIQITVITNCVKCVQKRTEFGLNTGKYGPEKTPYLDTFHAVLFSMVLLWLEIFWQIW